MVCQNLCLLFTGIELKKKQGARCTTRCQKTAPENLSLRFHCRKRMTQSHRNKQRAISGATLKYYQRWCHCYALQCPHFTNLRPDRPVVGLSSLRVQCGGFATDVGHLDVDGKTRVVQRRSLENDAAGADQACQRKDPQEQPVKHHGHVLPVLAVLRCATEK